MKLVAQNTDGSVVNMPEYESSFVDGDEGEVRLFVTEILTDEQLFEIEQEIISQGVVLVAPVVQSEGIVFVRFRKESSQDIGALPLLLIIGGAVAAAASGLLGWQIFKTSQQGVPTWVWLVGGAGILFLILSPKKKTGGTTIQADRVYVKEDKGYENTENQSLGSNRGTI